MSTAVGPAGSTRFSTRTCGTPPATSYTGRFQRQIVPLCSRSSSSCGTRPSLRSSNGSVSSVSGSSPGK